MKLLSFLAFALAAASVHAAPVTGHFTLDVQSGQVSAYGVATPIGSSGPVPTGQSSITGTFAVDSSLLSQPNGGYWIISGELTAFSITINGIVFDPFHGSPAWIYGASVRDHELSGLSGYVGSQSLPPHITYLNLSLLGDRWTAAGIAEQGYETSFLSGGVGTMHFSIDAVPPPVPEPETYTMLLAGMGLVGAVARRRQKRA
jgi:hypothetical protein